jgi:uncharacterized protein
MNGVEIRTFAAEIRADGGGKTQIKGTASVFGVMSDDLGGFREIIDPWSFGDLIHTNDVFALINHDANLVLGRNKSGTLTLEENEKGLDFIVDPSGTTYANDLLINMRLKNIDKCSFAFRVLDDSWETVNGQDVRHIHKFAELLDVSVVTYPAFYQTNAQVNGKDITSPEKVYAEFRSMQNKPEQPEQKDAEIEAQEKRKLEKEYRDRQIKILSL